MSTVSFTTGYDDRRNQLVNNAYIHANGRSYEARALWDTGATHTCIDDALAQRLGLVELGSVDVYTPSGRANLTIYRADIVLMGVIPMYGHKVTGSVIGMQGIDLLIGMDIISKGDFATSCKDGRTRFTFRIPSIEDADYT